jgi:signal peptidase I
MSFWTTLKSFFSRRSPDPLSGYAALGTPRMKIGDRGILAGTGSMEPKYTRGDLFTVTDKDFHDLMVGDIVVAWWEGKEFNVPHRIIATGWAGNGELYYVTKGDANPYRDAHTLTIKEYIGVAKFDKDLITH